MTSVLRPLALVSMAAVLMTGCISEYRESTTARTATEVLLVSTAAVRAIQQYDPTPLSGHAIAIDDARFEGVDKPYVVSALANHLASHGVQVVPLDSETPHKVMEIRNGTLGINDDGWGVGVPALPFPIPQTTLSSTSPPLYLFYKDKQASWAKLQLWLYDPATAQYLSQSGDLWGQAYHTRWWVLFLGPFESSNDIYPDEDLLDSGASFLE